MVLKCCVAFEDLCHTIILGCRSYDEAIKQQNCTARAGAGLPMGAIVEVERSSETPGAVTDNAGDHQSTGH